MILLKEHSIQKKEGGKKTKVERKPDAGGPHPRQLKPPDMPEDGTISSGHMPTHSVIPFSAQGIMRFLKSSDDRHISERIKREFKKDRPVN
jgi:hypothetical protein